MFGEKSSISDQVNICTVECVSKVAVVYKIHRTNLIQHFGGIQGEPANYLRALALTKHHWFNVKFEAIKAMSTEKVIGLEYRDDSVYNKLQKTAKAIYVKETPFAVNE